MMFLKLGIKEVVMIAIVIAIIGCSKTDETENPFDKHDLTVTTNNSKIKASLPQINTSEYSYFLQLKVAENAGFTVNSTVYSFDLNAQTNDYEKIFHDKEFDQIYYFQVIATLTDGENESFESRVKSVQLVGSYDPGNPYYNADDAQAEYSFTKLDSSGNALAVQNLNYSDTGFEAAGTQWSCVLDNDTGIVWEVKNKTNFTHKYTWYESNELINGGYAGTDSTSCASDQVACTTQGYIDYMNSINYCGKNNWVLPNPRIYFSIVSFDNLNPSTHQVMFSKLLTLLNLSLSEKVYYWMGTTYVANNQYAWLLDPYDWSVVGGEAIVPVSIKSKFHYVRLITHLCDTPTDYKIDSGVGTCQ